MSEDDLRDCFAMFALLGVRSSTTANYEEQAKWCYEMADAMLEARKPKEEAGLPAIRRRVKKGE
jgi:hypothetical protein